MAPPPWLSEPRFGNHSPHTKARKRWERTAQQWEAQHQQALSLSPLSRNAYRGEICSSVPPPPAQHFQRLQKRFPASDIQVQPRQQESSRPRGNSSVTCSGNQRYLRGSNRARKAFPCREAKRSARFSLISHPFHSQRAVTRVAPTHRRPTIPPPAAHRCRTPDLQHRSLEADSTSRKPHPPSIPPFPLPHPGQLPPLRWAPPGAHRSPAQRRHLAERGSAAGWETPRGFGTEGVKLLSICVRRAGECFFFFPLTFLTATVDSKHSRLAEAQNARSRACFQ